MMDNIFYLFVLLFMLLGKRLHVLYFNPGAQVRVAGYQFNFQYFFLCKVERRGAQEFYLPVSLG